MTSDHSVPPGAYSRVTHPERFASLHDTATAALERLRLKFRVEQVEGYGLDQELEQIYKLARPSIRLVPQDPLAAPIVVAFSAFPGLHVRFGYWCLTAFPRCGCDACGETAKGEALRLTSMIADVTEGRFREAVRVPSHGDAWAESEFWSFTVDSKPLSHSIDRYRIDPVHARQLIVEANRTSYEWIRWPI